MTTQLVSHSPATAARPSVGPVYADALPPWLRYLVAAYPAAKLAAATFAVYEDAFTGYDPELMGQAVRAVVADCKFFPSAAELRKSADRMAEKREIEAIQQSRRNSIATYRAESPSWPVCPACGERRDPEWDSCPGCTDLASMLRSNER